MIKQPAGFEGLYKRAVLVVKLMVILTILQLILAGFIWFRIAAIITAVEYSAAPAERPPLSLEI